MCGFPHKDTAPLPYPHLLAFPLHLELMTSPEFPFPAIGSVHLENTITAHRAIEVGEALEVTVTVRGPRPHPKGALVDFVTEVRGSEHVAWESVSTYLRRGASAAGEPGAPTSRCPTRSPAGSTGGCRPTSGAATPRSRATATRSTSTRGRRGRWASRATSRTGCRPWPAASRRWRTGCPRRCRSRSPSASRCCCPGSVRFATSGDRHERSFSLADPANGSAHLVGRARAL